MKTTFIAAIIFIMATTASTAQQNWTEKSKIPELATESFSEKFPDAKAKKWKSKKATFIAKFSSNGKKYEATFNADGKWVETLTRIKWEELPGPVRKTFYASEFIWLNWTSVKKLDTPEKGIIYLIEGDNMNEESSPICRFRLYFSEDGVIVREESNC